jgi:hypothetical protein
MYPSSYSRMNSANKLQEDVLQLVELSDELRRKRKLRIEIERTSMRDPPRSSGGYDEKFYEREVSYDSRRQRYR